MKYFSKKHKENISKAKVGHKVTQETRDKISNSKKGKPTWNKGLKGYLAGEKHYLWKGLLNRHAVHHRIRQTLKYKEWRLSVFERDNYTCQICGKHGCYLEADHIKSFAEYPKLRFDVDNGRTLCRKCHENTPSFPKQFRKKK